MNNKFFGDKNDFFKYDLLSELLENSSFLKQLTFIPMLTPFDGRKGGEMTSYEPEERRVDLYEFLKSCLDTGRRDICHLREYFAKKRRSFKYTPFRDSTLFSNKTRGEYFDAIPGAALEDALIFIDPDNGLASSEKKTDDKHLTYSELREIYARIEPPSILVVYQHLARVPRGQLFRSIDAKLEQLDPKPTPVFVSDNRIAFIVLPAVSRTLPHVERVLRNYATKHRLEPGVWPE